MASTNINRLIVSIRFGFSDAFPDLRTSRRRTASKRAKSPPTLCSFARMAGAMTEMA
jgi:hypothetical protein